MSQSLACVYLHITFSTKSRATFLKDEALRRDLQAYMAGVLKNIDCEAVIINGTEDHVHILCHLSRSMTIADLVRDCKNSSSKWVKQQAPQSKQGVASSFQDFAWQSGYAAFSVSKSNVETVRGYIAAQQEHHRKVSFQDEYRLLCQKHEVALNERYAWD